ncbi:Hypothetical predicted protein, partial [Paramuricea clavata]
MLELVGTSLSEMDMFVPKSQSLMESHAQKYDHPGEFRAWLSEQKEAQHLDHQQAEQLAPEKKMLELAKSTLSNIPQNYLDCTFFLHLIKGLPRNQLSWFDGSACT